MSFQLLENKKASLSEAGGGGLIPKGMSCNFSFSQGISEWEQGLSSTQQSFYPLSICLKAAKSFQSYQLTGGERRASVTTTGSHRQPGSFPSSISSAISRVIAKVQFCQETTQKSLSKHKYQDLPFPCEKCLVVWLNELLEGSRVVVFSVSQKKE